MFEHIAIGYDGSQAAAQAFNLALDLAGRYGAVLHVVAVAGPTEAESEPKDESVIDSCRQQYWQALLPLQGQAEDAHVKARFEVVEGNPADEIVSCAERHGADLIVVGHRGHGLIARMLLGSVAKQIIDRAHCAVLVSR